MPQGGVPTNKPGTSGSPNPHTRFSVCSPGEEVTLQAEGPGEERPRPQEPQIRCQKLFMPPPLGEPQGPEPLLLHRT